MTTPSPSAYPLQWPAGWPRTEPQRREHSKFKTTLTAAISNMTTEIKRMGGTAIILSSNCALGQTNATDPGVVVYFQWQGTAMAVPCDRWNRVDANVQAIALTIEAMRGMERWGAKHMIRAMFSGFKQLTSGSRRPWWDVMGILADSPTDLVHARYRELAKQRHPDTGGNGELFATLQNAYEDFKRERHL